MTRRYRSIGGKRAAGPYGQTFMVSDAAALNLVDFGSISIDPVPGEVRDFSITQASPVSASVTALTLLVFGTFSATRVVRPWSVTPAKLAELKAGAGKIFLADEETILGLEFVGMTVEFCKLIPTTAAGDGTGRVLPVGVPTAPAAFSGGQWAVDVSADQVYLVVSWSSLPDDGDSPVLSLQYRIDGGAPVSFASVGADDPSVDTSGTANVFGLTANVEYDFEVRAVNAVGEGPWSSVKSQTIPPPSTALLPTGGTITVSGGYRIHVFETSGDFVVPAGPSLSNVEIWIVAGGGSGGYDKGGGGGSGGIEDFTGVTLAAGTYPAVVGAGGAARTTSGQGNNGGDSSFNGVTAVGGGGGACQSSTTLRVGKDGGSGGGGGGANTGTPLASGGAATAGQGNPGGAGYQTSSGDSRAGGGGGGAGGAGGNASSSTGGNGGLPVAINYDGTSRQVGAGGGGYGASAGGSGGSSLAGHGGSA